MRAAALRIVVQELPPLPRYEHGPHFAHFIELHLMGVERSMFEDDLAVHHYDRYFHAVRMETIYRIMGLVGTRSMN